MRPGFLLEVSVTDLTETSLERSVVMRRIPTK
jgi:hypothetical protein